VIADLLRALQLLTVLPVRPRWDKSVPPGRAMAAFPLVGVLLGITLGVLSLLLRETGLHRVAPFLPSALVVTAWAMLTGGLHLDGWADCCDALFVPVTRERRLDILRDPRVGSFGVVGLVLLLLIKFAAIPINLQPLGVFRLLIVAPVLGRWAMVMAALHFPLARDEGMAFHFCQGAGRREVFLATLTTVFVCVFAGAVGVAAFFASVLVMLTFARWASARLGGLTGDVYGAIVELVETITLVVGAFASSA
jgi:adenosylcobinamide-GDP ribazoletransferase